MTIKTIDVEIPLDEKGFVELECPHCGENFKIKGSDFETLSFGELFCPNCGLKADKEEFFTDEVMEHANDLVKNEMFELLNGFNRDLEKVFKSSNFIKVKTSSPISKISPKRIIAFDSLMTHEVNCCKKEIKLNTVSFNSYCPFCGVK